jgi:DNA-binding NarL/FixJ family response regulator/Tfp pilus assembly protein PilZ
LAIPLLRVELDHFSARHRLTAREQDVVFLLASGCTTVPQIAGHLGLSENTVHNHFKNVFRRTRTNSKAALLSLFLTEALSRHAGLEPFVRRPRVLLVEPDRQERGRIASGLRARGMHVAEEQTAEAALGRLGRSHTDVLITDVECRNREGEPLVALAARLGAPEPSVLALVDAHRDAPLHGASQTFSRPVSADRLAFAVAERCVESEYVRSRFLRVETELPARVDGASEAQVANLGFGGAFLALSEQSLAEPSRFPIGSRVELSFELEDRRPVQAAGEVRWRRASSRPASRAGVGVEFTDMGDESRDAVEEFVRSRRLASFLPPGGPTRSAERTRA